MTARIRKPDWLKTDIGIREQYNKTHSIITEYGLRTICSSGKCPNQGECWRRGTATFLICGEVCTRACKFCNTPTGHPLPPDPTEPLRVAKSIALMGLKHTVITSVDRDDLPDYGAAHWASVLSTVKQHNPGITIEALIPDFKGQIDLIDRVIDAKPDVISHNMETVERLTPLVRSRAASYRTSLNVLAHLSYRSQRTKSGIMVGMGETEEEVCRLMDHLLGAGCKILTIGQYLQPTSKHYPVAEYITPDMFLRYKETGLNKGFEIVESAPLVRSSYHAEKHICAC